MIDLHMHTTHSDGSDSVEELLTKAEKLKLSLISITDHDSIDGYKELKAIMDNPPANVKFIGIIPRKEMNDIFNMTDVLFMPSFAELFPMSILEAVNSYTPVLLRDLDLYEDILFNKYEKAHDVDGFSNIIEKLATDKTYYQAASENSKYISAFYSKENVAKIWREYYPRVLAKHNNK